MVFARAPSCSAPRTDIATAAAARFTREDQWPFTSRLPIARNTLTTGPRAWAPDRAPSPRAAQPHADPLLFAQHHAEGALHQLAAGPVSATTWRGWSSRKRRANSRSWSIWWRTWPRSTRSTFSWTSMRAMAVRIRRGAQEELTPYLKASEPGPLLAGYIGASRSRRKPRSTSSGRSTSSSSTTSAISSAWSPACRRRRKR